MLQTSTYVIHAMLGYELHSEPCYVPYALQGVIQHSTINNLSFGRNPDETRRVLQAIQYVQENPDEVRTAPL